MNWYTNSYRKLFFDFHNISSTIDLAKEFNAEKWAEKLENVQAQAVSSFAKCGAGWRYYQNGKIGWIHPKLPKNLDILGETITVCHKRGIKVIAYYHTFYSEPIAEKFPEWREKESDNKYKGISICMLSPLLEEHMIPQLEEIVKNYEIDGLFLDGTIAQNSCYCESCRKKFKNFSGLDIPIDTNSPDWKTYIKWKLDIFKEIRKKIIKTIYEKRKDVLIAFNYAYTIRQPEIPPANLGFITLDINPKNQVFTASYQTKYLSTLNTSFDIMNTAFLQWWGDYGMKPSTSLKQECATIIANGAKTFIGHQMYPQFKVEDAIMGEFKKTFDFVKKREDICKDTTPLSDVAVLSSTHSYFTHKPNFFIDETPLRGLHKILLESGISYNILNEKNLLENINNYKLIILPDQRYIDTDLIQKLKKFVEKGGSLIATYLTASQDKNYQFKNQLFLEDILGIKFKGFYPNSHAYIDIRDNQLKKNCLDMPILTWTEFTYVNPVTCRVLADLRDIYLRNDNKLQFQFAASSPHTLTGYPSITLNNIGKGKAVYISGDIFSAYIKKNQWNLKYIVKNLIDMLISEKLIELDAPDVIEVVAAKKNNNIIIHLINHNGERSIDDNYALTEHIIPIYNMKMKIRCKKYPKSIKLLPENIPLSGKFDNNTILIDIPKIEIHSSVIIEQ
ncbi:MAG: beta-galactosidase trimerization domain-containing protein [Candidatus Omnitrophica bacterium]|jgi:hypothetical protein|nr:beta-galactosidase trimerization domain-containing protein [Candidatus Omnitrophota bacterium]